jgi:hypothetical protein
MNPSNSGASRSNRADLAQIALPTQQPFCSHDRELQTDVRPNSRNGALLRRLQGRDRRLPVQAFFSASHHSATRTIVARRDSSISSATTVARTTRIRVDEQPRLVGSDLQFGGVELAAAGGDIAESGQMQTGLVIVIAQAPPRRAGVPPGMNSRPRRTPAPRS